MISRALARLRRIRPRTWAWALFVLVLAGVAARWPGRSEAPISYVLF